MPCERLRYSRKQLVLFRKLLSPERYGVLTGSYFAACCWSRLFVVSDLVEGAFVLAVADD